MTLLYHIGFIIHYNYDKYQRVIYLSFFGKTRKVRFVQVINVSKDKESVFRNAFLVRKGYFCFYRFLCEKRHENSFLEITKHSKAWKLLSRKVVKRGLKHRAVDDLENLSCQMNYLPECHREATRMTIVQIPGA